MPTKHRFACLLIGAGGHARVVLDALTASRPEVTVEARDDNPALAGTDLLSCLVQVPISGADPTGRQCHVAIGHNATRQQMAMKLQGRGGQLLTILHPASCVSPYSDLGAGCFLAAGAILAPEAKLGDGVILNHGAVVDHHCQIGAWSHIAPGAIIGGGVIAGKGVLLGAGCVVLPGLQIGENSIIGAGAVVTRDVAAGETWAGVPAKELYGKC